VYSKCIRALSLENLFQEISPHMEQAEVAAAWWEGVWVT
jgi:hypothetical protein